MFDDPLMNVKKPVIADNAVWALLIVEGCMVTYSCFNVSVIWSLVKAGLIGNNTTSSFFTVI